MADTSAVSPNVRGLDPSYTSLPETKKTKGDTLGKDDFLQLLIAQLKTQDPLDPAKPEEFAANLAQFTSLEQLMGINAKLEGSAGGGLSSMASYLGQEVFVDAQDVAIAEDSSEFVSFTVPSDVSGATLNITDASGVVVKTHDLGALEAGAHRVSVQELGLRNGTYSMGVAVRGTSGQEVEIPAQIGGVVTGFIPGPTPQLMIGDRQLDPSTIRRVQLKPEPVVAAK